MRDRVQGLAELRAIADVGGIEVEQMVWQAAGIRDGKLGWWALFRDEHAARAAAGLWRTDGAPTGPASSSRAPRRPARPG